MNNTPITCKPAPLCPVCGSTGVTAYTDCQDRLFGVSGNFDMSSCPNKKCGVYWVNPTPDSSELPRLYTSYSTHGTPPQISASNNSLLSKVRRAVLATDLRYPAEKLRILYNLISYLHPAWRDTQIANVFYLPSMTGGKLLDIGCGNGSSMLTMQAQGWQVTGIDFDEVAIAQARNNDLNASVSDLFSASYSDNQFDAIMMNHVIEHVPDPQAFIKECLRILKPGGTLVALTPNINSLGHKKYRQDWRGLETPRHLQIFNPNSLRLLATDTGFTTVEAFTSTQGILQIYDESKACNETGTFDLNYSSRTNKYIYHLRWFVAGWRHVILPTLSEVTVLRTRK